MLFGKTFTTRMTSVLGGMFYALAVFFLMWFVVLPAIDPVMLNLNPYVFALAHLVWGMVLGYMVYGSQTQHTAVTLATRNIV